MKIFALLLFVSNLLWPAFGQTSSGAVKSAREKLLAKDRVGAAKILIQAIKLAPSKEKPELIDELDKLTSVFLTEDGQKIYEMAESLLYSESAGAESKYAEALSLEDSNLQVMSGLVRAHLGKNKCDNARELLVQMTKMNPYQGEIKFLEALTNHCQKLNKLDNDLNFGKGELRPYWQLLYIRQLLGDNKIREARSQLRELKDWDHPEVAYFEFKARSPNSDEALDFAQKYVDKCKAMTPAMRRKFKFEPRLCAHVSEAESFIANSEAAK